MDVHKSLGLTQGKTVPVRDRLCNLLLAAAADFAVLVVDAGARMFE